MTRFYIQIGRKRHYFDTLADAVVVANRIHARTGVIVGIFQA